MTMRRSPTSSQKHADSTIVNSSDEPRVRRFNQEHTPLLQGKGVRPKTEPAAPRARAFSTETLGPEPSGSDHRRWHMVWSSGPAARDCDFEIMLYPGRRLRDAGLQDEGPVRTQQHLDKDEIWKPARSYSGRHCVNASDHHEPAPRGAHPPDFSQ